MLPTIKSPTSGQRRAKGRLWQVPDSRAWWISLAITIAIYALALIGYLLIVRAPGFTGKPGKGALVYLGLTAFCLLLVSASYTLRRRFVRILPGKVRDWLWVHTWIGGATLLVAMLHANFDHVLRNFCFRPGCMTDGNFGTAALSALIALVATGVIGRLLDGWQTRVIARDAGTNGVGILPALKERILELEYTIERLYAGKSEPFQQFCMQATLKPEVIQSGLPALPPYEQADFRQALELLTIRVRLLDSLNTQQRAHALLRWWRYVHIALACIAFAIILLHALLNLSTLFSEIGRLLK